MKVSSMQFALRNSLLAAVIFLGSGCSYLPSAPWSTPASQSDPTAEALFQEGMDYFNNKKYARAIDRLERVKADFPFSPQLVPAELKIAEAYYLNKQYPEAAAAFKEFQAMHPTNEKIPFVIYHLGLTHFEQFTSVDRDQKVTEIAKGYFETVVKNYPNSPYAGKAKEKLAKCREYLAEHEFIIAAFYMRQKKFPAARGRFEEILRRYRDTPTAVKSLYQLGESYRLGENSLKAALAYRALIQNYPESPLVKGARTHLKQLEKERHDPLAMLLARDGKPAFVPPPNEGSGGIQDPRSKIQNRKELNLVAKKEVVHEEPGDGKGFFRRLVDTVNPFASSSDEKKENRKIETVKEESAQEEADGFFASLWKGLNPFSSEEKKKTETASDPRLVGKVDESLRQQGVKVGDQKPESEIRDPKSGIESPELRPPASELPQIAEERSPPPADTAELLGKVDVTLRQKGKETEDLPPLPEIAPALRASASRKTEKATIKAETTPSSSSSGVVTGIDKALKQKGIELPEVEIPDGSSVMSGTQDSNDERPIPPRTKKVELDTKLQFEKGPLFLEGGELPVQGKAKEDEEASRPDSLKASEPPSVAESQPLKELPQAVLTDPAQRREKLAEKKKPEEKGEEDKGMFDQLREDVEDLGTLLNPFGF